MCLLVHLSDVRLALLDLCEDDAEVDEYPQPDDLIAQLNAPVDGPMVHELDHRRRAEELASRGDESGAAIHRALSENMLHQAR